jgi:hypothetical protein
MLYQRISKVIKTPAKVFFAPAQRIQKAVCHAQYMTGYRRHNAVNAMRSPSPQIKNVEISYRE